MIPPVAELRLRRGRARLRSSTPQLAEELSAPGEDALGRLIAVRQRRRRGAISAEHPPSGWLGIMPSVKHSLGDPRPSRHVWLCARSGQHYESAMTLQIRLAGEGGERAMVGTIARVVREVDERLPVLRVATWRDHLDADVEASLYRVGAGVFWRSPASRCCWRSSASTASSCTSSRAGRANSASGSPIGAQPRALLWQVLREGSPHHGDRHRDRAAAGRRRRAGPAGHPVRSEQHRTGGAGDSAG